MVSFYPWLSSSSLPSFLDHHPRAPLTRPPIGGGNPLPAVVEVGISPKFLCQ